MRKTIAAVVVACFAIVGCGENQYPQVQNQGQPQVVQQDSGPGFWTGMLAGGALGHLMTRKPAQQVVVQQPVIQQPPVYVEKRSWLYKRTAPTIITQSSVRSIDRGMSWGRQTVQKTVTTTPTSRTTTFRRK